MKEIDVPPTAADGRRYPSPIPALEFEAYELDDGIVLIVFDLRPGRKLPSPLLRQLTDGQRRVVEQAVIGLGDSEIAHRLGLSRHTVSNLLRRAYARLGVSGRVELCAHLRGASATSAE